jgi:hypothetical protein
MTGDDVWQMADVRHPYPLPHEVRDPLLCFDERPCSLSDEIGGILPMRPGTAKRSQYE